MKQGGTTAAVVPMIDDVGPLAVTSEPLPREELDSKLDQAREHLLTLRRQQEDLERQKGELEELRRKQTEYTRGRAEMLENLSRGLVTVEREQIQSQRVAEQCDRTLEAFREYLEQLESINDENWTPEDLRPELSRALGIIENSRLEYNRARTKLDCLNPSANQPAAGGTVDTPKDEGQELLRYFKLGAAASAPLILSGTIWFLVWLVVR